MDLFHDKEVKEDKHIIDKLLRNESDLIELLGRLIPEQSQPGKIRPILSFKLFINNKNFNFMAQIKSLTLISTAPVTLSVTVVDATTGIEIAGVLSGLAYNPADATQDIAVVDPVNPLDVDVHAVSNTGGTTVTGTGNFVSTLKGADGVTPAFSGTVTGTLVLVNNIPVAVLNPVLAFNQ